MSIRRTRRDHLADRAPGLAAVPLDATQLPETGDELLFYAVHEGNVYLADFRELRTGREGGIGTWSGRYKGRPALAHELAPYLKHTLRFKSRDTVLDRLGACRVWWRAFDALESTGETREVKSARHITELVVRSALDTCNVSRKAFYTFIGLTNLVRAALKAPVLITQAPERSAPKRKLPPEDDISRIWGALKRGWFSVLGRWRELDSRNPCAKRYSATVSTPDGLSTAPYFAQLQPDRELTSWADVADWVGLTVEPEGDLMRALAGHFPGPTEIRYAFFLFLAGSRWNVQPVLDIPVDPDSPARPLPTLRLYPGDDARFLLTSFKRRGNSEPQVVGRWKTDRAPGVILKTLVERTWPLRVLVLHELKQARQSLERAQQQGASATALKPLFDAVHTLTATSKSAWLYVYQGRIRSLLGTNFAANQNTGLSFIDRLVLEINQNLPEEKQIVSVDPSDFRDAFAKFALEEGGGSMHTVQFELDHKDMDTTVNYLDNTVVNAENAQALLMLTDTLFEEFAAKNDIDPTVLARICRDGGITEEDRTRLREYRELRTSRLGVPCSDSKNPPRHIDPHFVPDGTSECVQQRCTLCFENARVTAESIDGICMRAEELSWLEGRMPIQAFVAGRYAKELANAETHLLAFDPAQVRERRANWAGLIASGMHRPPEVNGLQTL